MLQAQSYGWVNNKVQIQAIQHMNDGMTVVKAQTGRYAWRSDPY
ncbi:MAG: hypothetical protein WAM09_15025 [Anaerolineales bacterium]